MGTARMVRGKGMNEVEQEKDQLGEAWQDGRLLPAGKQAETEDGSARVRQRNQEQR